MRDYLLSLEHDTAQLLADDTNTEDVLAVALAEERRKSEMLAQSNEDLSKLMVKRQLEQLRAPLL
jgi:hypothetical protein